MAPLICLAPLLRGTASATVWSMYVYLLDFPDMTWAEFHPILSLHKALQGTNLA